MEGSVVRQIDPVDPDQGLSPQAVRAVNLQVPAVGESITSVQIGAWRKSEGDVVTADEVVVELETDKAAVELPAPVSGTLGPHHHAARDGRGGRRRHRRH